MGKHILLSCVLLGLLSFGSAYGQSIPKQTSKKVKIKPAPKIKVQDIKKADKKLALTSDEKAIRKANQSTIRDQQKAFQKANKQAEREMKAKQKAYAKALREAEKQANKK